MVKFCVCKSLVFAMSICDFFAWTKLPIKRRDSNEFITIHHSNYVKKNVCDSFSSLASMSYRIVFCLNPLVIFSRQFNSRFSVVHHKLCINYSNQLFGRKSLCILNVNQPVVFFFQLNSHKITEKPIISLNRWKGCKAGPMPIIFIRLYWYSKIQSKRSFIWFIEFDCNVLMLRNEKLLE